MKKKGSMKRSCVLKAGHPPKKKSKARELEDAATCMSGTTCSSKEVHNDVQPEKIKACTVSQVSESCPSNQMTDNDGRSEVKVRNSFVDNVTSDKPGTATRTSASKYKPVEHNCDNSSPSVKQTESEVKTSIDEETSDDDSDNWQEVEDNDVSSEPYLTDTCMQESIKEKKVEIDISIPGTSKGKGSSCRTGNRDWAKYLQWQVNRSNKTYHEKIHKAHLVCLLASALYTNEICNSRELQARALSQVPGKLLCENSSTSYNELSWITKVVKWFSASFKLNTQGNTKTSAIHFSTLSGAIEEMSASGESMIIYVCICLIMLRALGLQARLVQSFQPIPLKYTKLSKVGKGLTKVETSEKAKCSIEIKTASKTKLCKYSTRDAGKYSKVNQCTSWANDFSKTCPKKPKKKMEVTTGVTYDQSSRQTRNAANRLILSSDSEEDSPSNFPRSGPSGACIDCWIEVYNSSETKWIPVDCIEGNINRPDLCEQNATKPVCYVIAVDNENNVKDVTKRYASKWMFETEKLRVQSTWWKDTLKPYRTKHIQTDCMEDVHLNNQLQERPLPTSISEYKNHHLYVLKRHLLKFEALYPESPAVLGYCRGEAVYSRDCVHTLHSRETWLKEGLAIKSDEEPYKIVKSRPKKNKTITPPLSVYGKWQTELYIPPPAVDGKVPRNHYGNVELFQPSMLPMGTVHLQLPGLNQTARKLNIDCAPAMVGWDYHGGFCHPVLDGYIVCKEFQEVLLDAWEKDVAEREQKLKQKRELRAVKNWKILIQGVLIKERLIARFQEADSNITMQGHQKCWPENKLS